MNRSTALVLGGCLIVAAVLRGGIWDYGDGFIFNRFTGTVVYVQVPCGDSEPSMARDIRRRSRRVAAPRGRALCVGRALRF